MYTLMTESQCKAMVLENIEKHLNSNWTFKWSNAKRSAGSCRIKGIKLPSGKSKIVKGTISISKSILKEMTYEGVKDTILHEIAHAIQYEKTGSSDHGPIWKKIAKSLGAVPKAAAQPEHFIKGKVAGIEIIDAEFGPKDEAAKKPEKKKTSKPGPNQGVGAFVYALIAKQGKLKNPTLTTKQFTEKVREEFGPTCKHSDKCTGWYLAKARKRGIVSKEFRLKRAR